MSKVAPNTPKAQGVIHAIRADKGYGFARTPSCEKDVFFHESACLTDFGELVPGDQITFKLVHVDKGFRGLEIEKVDE